VGFVVEGIDHAALAVGAQRASVSSYLHVLGLHRRHEAEWDEAPAVAMTEESGPAPC
jgi:hypothetical protein